MKMAHMSSSFTSTNLDDNIAVTRLERNIRDVQQLRCKLNSYHYEPKTYGMFERIESLKNDLETLKKSEQEIVTALKDLKKPPKGYNEIIKQQYSEFEHLQQGIKEYVTFCAKHDAM